MIKSEDGKAGGIIADLTSVSDIKNLAMEVKKIFGRVDVLINCVGFFLKVADLVDAEESDMDLIIDGNLKSAYRCCKYFLPMMIKQKSGLIINIGSQSGKLPQPGASIYAAAKSGLISFTKSLELEVKKFGIKVVVVNPGSTDSPFHDSRVKKLDSELLSKFLRPDDIAKTCLFIAEQSENALFKEIDLVPLSESIEVTFNE
jgi:short-subunit dehydrogenase